MNQNIIKIQEAVKEELQQQAQKVIAENQGAMVGTILILHLNACKDILIGEFKKVKQSYGFTDAEIETAISQLVSNIVQEYTK